MRGFELVKREDHWGLYNEDGHKIAATIDGCYSKLSLKNCEAIKNGYDLDELAYTESEDFVDNFDYNDGYGNICRFNNSHEVQECYIKGFQKALEILGDKKFSEEDMIEFAKWTFLEVGSNTGKDRTNEQLLLEWKSIQQTEWDVEIITEPFFSVGDNFHDKYQTRPKLDENGCLILRRYEN